MVKKFFPFIFSLILGFFPLTSKSEMTGGDFEIFADTFSILQDELTTGGNFTLYNTGGELSATTTEGGNFSLRGGFQAIEKGSVSMNLNANTLSLGTLSLSELSSASLTMTVSADGSSGYSVNITEDGNLRTCNTGENDIDDVSDGTVTAGTEEYGVTTNGGGGTLNNDNAISGTLTIASAPGIVLNQQTTVTFKAAIGNTSRAGDYCHVVTFTGTANP